MTPLYGSIDLDWDGHAVVTFDYVETCPECGDATKTARTSVTRDGADLAICPSCSEPMGVVTERPFDADANRSNRAADEAVGK